MTNFQKLGGLTQMNALTVVGVGSVEGRCHKGDRLPLLWARDS